MSSASTASSNALSSSPDPSLLKLVSSSLMVIICRELDFLYCKNCSMYNPDSRSQITGCNILFHYISKDTIMLVTAGLAALLLSLTDCSVSAASPTPTPDTVLPKLSLSSISPLLGSLHLYTSKASLSLYRKAGQIFWNPRWRSVT